MTPKESPLNKYYDLVDGVVQKQLAEMDRRISAIDGSNPLSEIVTILSEANSLIYFASGQDADIYE